MDFITANIDHSKFDQALMQKVSLLRNIDPLLNEIGRLAAESVKRNFSAGGRPQKWVPSRERKANKIKRIARAKAGKPARAQKTLIDTGNLRGSITHQSVGNDVYVGTNVLYAPIHHFGGTINHPGGTPYIVTGAIGEDGAQFLRKDGNYPKGTKFTKAHTITMPARPFLLLQESDYRRINAIMKKHLDGANV